MSVATIQRWCTQYNWKKLKTSHKISKQETLRRLYEQIDEINDKIESRPKGSRYADNKDADVIIKLSNAIEKLEREIPIHIKINVFSDALRWFEKNRGIEVAKEFATISDEYIQETITPQIEK